MAIPESPRRRSRDDVAEMALHLLDEFGLPDLTMRRLATALGVQPSALYWHFPNKQALLAAVSEQILAPLTDIHLDELPLPRAACVLGARMRDCLLAHRDAAELVSSSLALGLVEPPVRPALLEAARRHGVGDQLAEVAAEVVVHFVLGFVFHEQQRLTADSLGLLERSPASSTDGAGFTEAMTLIADGLDVSIARRA
ncbi:TetR family transcriptional regulator [Brachybacterium vulturis]|uniref:TetR family transcriptional regulator n=1 Tax=Brachybacterium vulturis TaxID=2017484 RepID=UPI003735F239